MGLSIQLFFSILVIPLSLGLMFYALSRRTPPGIQMTPWISDAALLWAVSDLFLVISPPDLRQAHIISTWFRSLGMDILPIASLVQILLVTGRTKWPNKVIRMAFICTLLLEQGLFWFFENQATGVTPSTTIPFAIHMALRVTPLLAAGFVLADHSLHAPLLIQRISLFYLGSSLIIGMIYGIEFLGQPLFNTLYLSPILAVFSQFSFLAATNRYHMHALLPLTRNALMDKLGDAVIVLDPGGRFVDLNSSARRILNSMPDTPSQIEILNHPIGKIFPQLKRFFENPEQTVPSRFEIETDSHGEKRFMEVSISPLSGSTSYLIGYLLLMRDISRQKKEQTRQQERVKLWENQARLLDATLSASPDFLMINDRQGKFIYASPTFLEFVGFQPEGLDQRTWQDLNVSAEIKEIFVKQLEEALVSQKSHTFEFTVNNNSSTRFFEAYLSPFETGNPAVTHIASTVREVTSRRNVEEALKASEQRYRSIVEVLDEGIVIQDHQGRVTGCNRSAERLLGLTVDESLGKIFVDTQHLAIREDGSPFPHEEHPAMLALRTGKAQNKVIMGVKFPSQEMRWLLVNAQPLMKNNQASPYAVVSSYVDITPNKMAENALRDSQRRFETLLEYAPAAILVVDQESNILLVNSSAEGELGYSREQLLGKSLSILIPGRYRLAHNAHQEKFLQNPVARQMGTNLSLFALRADGSEFPVDIGLSPIETNEGMRIICYLVNVTERKRQEEALRQVNEQLSNSLADLRHHNRELILLGEMSEMLQRCESIEEAYMVATNFAQRLFPDLSGALYLHNPESLLLESTINWGDSPPIQTTFLPNACWSLRRGRAHTVEHYEEGLHCQHIDPGELRPQSGFICVPMQAQGQVMGMFHLRGSTESMIRSLENLAVTFTGHITISFLNISLRDSLRTQSIHDPLTGLHNRRYLEETLNREVAIASRYKRDLSVILFDIDHFKIFNDTHGHTFGDFLLRNIGEYLQKNLRSMDIACRYGGEEFLIILPDTSIENSLVVARKIKSGLSKLRFDSMRVKEVSVQVSMGVAAYQGESETSSDLIQRADQALYQAKQTGRNRIVTS